MSACPKLSWSHSSVCGVKNRSREWGSRRRRSLVGWKKIVTCCAATLWFSSEDKGNHSLWSRVWYSLNKVFAHEQAFFIFIFILRSFRNIDSRPDGVIVTCDSAHWSFKYSRIYRVLSSSYELTPSMWPSAIMYLIISLSSHNFSSKGFDACVVILSQRCLARAVLSWKYWSLWLIYVGLGTWWWTRTSVFWYPLDRVANNFKRRRWGREKNEGE